MNCKISFNKLSAYLIFASESIFFLEHQKNKYLEIINNNSLSEISYWIYNSQNPFSLFNLLNSSTNYLLMNHYINSRKIVESMNFEEISSPILHKQLQFAIGNCSKTLFRNYIIKYLSENDYSSVISTNISFNCLIELLNKECFQNSYDYLLHTLFTIK